MWVLFAALNPLSEAFRSLFVKKVSNKLEPLVISWANNFVPVVLFSPLLIFIDIKINPEFLIAFSISGIINIAAVILYMEAIKAGDISKVMPMLSFTPVFLLATSPLLVGEFPNIQGLFGIVLVFAGSYMLNIKSWRDGILEPIKSLFRDKGTRLMLIVAFIWSFSSNFDKISILNSSIPQHIIFMNILIFTALTMVTILKKKFCWKKIKTEKKNLLFISTFTAGTFIFQMTALSLTLVAYVIALKRMSGFISVLLGYLFLKEPDIKDRITGSTVMIAGVFLIVLS